MVRIYKDYQDEPEDIFRPLPADLSCQLYHLELKDFTDDIAFYRKFLPKNSTILEMGCGTGRVSRALADSNHPVTGIDISLPMLQIARQTPVLCCQYVCMDMTDPAFSNNFDTILIPYNTLNLLSQPSQLKNCFQSCHSLLHEGGQLIAQIFIPTEKRISQPEKSFQFQLFDRPEGGKIVKEIIQQYHAATQTMQIEERFRIRPMQEGENNEDYHSLYTTLAWNIDQWLDFFTESCFSPVHIYGDYSFSSFSSAKSTCFLIVLEKIS